MLSNEFVSTLLNNMPSLSEKTAKMWVENQEYMRKKLRNAFFLPFEIFKIVDVGTDLMADDFLKKLYAKKVKVSKEAKRIIEISTFKLIERGAKLILVAVTPEELGFKKLYVKQLDILEKAKEFGLNYVSPEATIGACLQLKKDEIQSLIVAMEGFNLINDDKPRVFTILSRPEGLMLTTYFKEWDRPWPSYQRFLFSSKII